MLDPKRPLEPPEYFVPTCPVCGEECEMLYKDYLHTVLGCDVCLTVVDAPEYWEGERV